MNVVSDLKESVKSFVGNDSRDSVESMSSVYGSETIYHQFTDKVRNFTSNLVNYTDDSGNSQDLVRELEPEPSSLDQLSDFVLESSKTVQTNCENFYDNFRSNDILETAVYNGKKAYNVWQDPRVKSAKFTGCTGIVAGAKLGNHNQEFHQTIVDQKDKTELELGPLDLETDIEFEIPFTDFEFDSGINIRDNLESANEYWDENMSRVIRDFGEVDSIQGLVEGTADKYGHFFCNMFMAEQAAMKVNDRLEGYQPGPIAIAAASTVPAYFLIKEGWIEGGMDTLNLSFNRLDLKADLYTDATGATYGTHNSFKKIIQSEDDVDKSETYLGTLGYMEERIGNALKAGPSAKELGRAFGTAEYSANNAIKELANYGRSESTENTSDSVYIADGGTEEFSGISKEDFVWEEIPDS
ncbi:MAG: hypothetical protein ABEJ56_03145 [Candidatus Nanohaloarchaea archaeon]